MNNGIFTKMIKEAEVLRKKNNISMLEAYNTILEGLDFSTLNEDQLKGLLIILKSEMALDNDNRPRINLITLVTWIILSVISLLVLIMAPFKLIRGAIDSLALSMVPFEFINGLISVAIAYVVFKGGEIAINRYNYALNNKDQQFNEAVKNVKKITELLKARTMSQVETLEATSEKNNKQYVDRLIELIEERYPFVPYGMMQDVSIEFLRLKFIYRALFGDESTSDIYDLFFGDVNVEAYKDNIGLFVADLENFSDKLIEITTPSEPSVHSLSDSQSRIRKNNSSN